MTNGWGHGSKKKGGLDGRHREQGGEISRKHGSTRVGTLREQYGADFAKGRRSDMMLKTLLTETKSKSLHEYLSKKRK
jgi:hypothetical protein